MYLKDIFYLLHVFGFFLLVHSRKNVNFSGGYCNDLHWDYIIFVF